MPTPSLKNIKYFVAVAQYKNFSLAANACFVNQSTLSAGIKRLEQELGACLIERNSKHVQLTTIGKEVLAHAQQLTCGAETLVAVARQDFFASHVRIGSIPTIAPFVLPEMLQHWRTNHPRLQVSVEENTSDTLLTMLRNYQLDCVLIALPYDIDGFAHYDLFVDQLHFIYHENSCWLSKNSDVADGGLLLLSHVHCLRDHIIDTTTTQHTTINSFHIQSLHMLAAMVAIDLGVSYMPDIAVKQGVLCEYKAIKSTPQQIDARIISLVYRPDTHFAEEIKHLIAPWCRL